MRELKKINNKMGFTMIELIAVMVIIGVILSAVLAAFQGQQITAG